MDAAVEHPALLTERFGVRGMTCVACARRVEAALVAVPGVQAAVVDLATAVATVRHEPAANQASLAAAVLAAGYDLAPARRIAGLGRLARPVAAGLLAALALLGVYLGLLTLAQGWAHAVTLLREDLPFIAVLLLGFGLQVGLFVHLRGLHAQATAGSVAASTGTSTAAMLACCAHHVADVLPILGLAGAASLLAAYKTPLLWLGILTNLAGVAYLLRRVRQARHTGLLVPASDSPAE